jgi:hypothetical protein
VPWLVKHDNNLESHEPDFLCSAINSCESPGSGEKRREGERERGREWRKRKQGKWERGREGEPCITEQPRGS